MVRSTFAGFSVAQLAMAASQNALDIVGQNVSNIHTGGYTRQRLDQQSVSPTGHSAMNSPFSVKVGQGVMAIGVSQIRDPFLDIQYRTQLSEVGTVDAMDAVLARLGDIFDETASSKIGTALNEVISQLENMARPDTGGQDTYDTIVRSAMETFINLIHDNANEITSVKQEYIDKLTGSESSEIESYLTKIVELNQSIKNSQVLGNPALELMDQRNELIDSLATYLPIDVIYEDQSMGANIKVETLKITFTDANGNVHTLVDDNERGTVDIAETPGMGISVSITGVGAAGPTDVTDALGEGVLKGYSDMLNERGVYGNDDTKGIGFYEDYFNEFVNMFATTLNNLNAPGGALFETSDGSATFTAANIKVSAGWLDGTVSITTSTDPNAGPGAYENVQRMINALSKDNQNFTDPATGSVVFTGTFLEGYDFLQNTQAVERSSVATILSNRTTTLEQIANSKDSVSSVSLDEEVMNMMRYQQSYSAAARLMTTLDQALDTLINNTGVVGR